MNSSTSLQATESKEKGIDTAQPETRQEVVITDIHMPFTSMVGFMVKLAIASIPALIILFSIGVLVAAFIIAAVKS